MATYYKPTEQAQKMAELAKKVPAPLSWLIPDPYNPASYMAPVGMPFYRVEVPRINYKWLDTVRSVAEKTKGWKGAFFGHRPNEEIESIVQELGHLLQSPKPTFNTIPDKISTRSRFLFREQAASKPSFKASPGEPIVEVVKKLAKKYPNDVRLLEFPNAIEKFAVYSDPDQIAVPLRKMFQYMKKVE